MQFYWALKISFILVSFNFLRREIAERVNSGLAALLEGLNVAQTNTLGSPSFSVSHLTPIPPPSFSSFLSPHLWGPEKQPELVSSGDRRKEPPSC